MNICFSYLDRETLIPCNEGDMITLYDVPTDYSEDGFYAAVWRHGSIEPHPACAGDTALVLAKITILRDKDDIIIKSMFFAEGVDAYAAH